MEFIQYKLIETFVIAFIILLLKTTSLFGYNVAEAPHVQ